MLRRCGVASQEDASRPDTHPKSKGNILKINYLQAQSNWCRETWIGWRLTHFKEKGKIDSRWDEADDEIARQVASGSSSYEKQDSSGKLKAPHHKRFLLVATLHGASTALCQNEYANVNPTTRSAPAEFTLKECDMDLPRNKREEQQSQCSTHFSLRGQVDGIWRPLSMVVPSTAMKDYRDGRRDKCASDDEPHWVPSVYFLAYHLAPNFQF